MKDYVLSHNWGSFESDQSIKKLRLRNKEDFKKYFINFALTEYRAKIEKLFFLIFDDKKIEISTTYTKNEG